MNKALKKTLKIIGIVLASIVGLFLLLYFILFLIGLGSYGEARSVRKYVCTIPELNSGFAPQGITYADDCYILTGYGSDNTVRLYIVDGDKFKRVSLVDGDGNALKGHAGGVACTKNNVYIANDSALLLFALDELKAADGSPVTVKRSIPVDNRAAYCFGDDNYLYVGEFYRAGNYETAAHHRYTTPNGCANTAIVSRYPLDGEGLLVDIDAQPYPDRCISVKGLVQGFAVLDGKCVLSRSYGLKNSTLEYYGSPRPTDRTISVKFEAAPDAAEKQVPLYYLDDTIRYKTLTLPAFGEDITVVDGRVVHTNESSANKYIVGKLFGANKVYSYPMYEENEEN